MKFMIFENPKTHETQSVLIDDDGRVIISKKGENGEIERIVVPKSEQSGEHAIEQTAP